MADAMASLFERTPRTDAFWRAYAGATGTGSTYDVVAFGDCPAMATELAELVLAGPKRATAGLARDFGEAEGKEPMPVVGGHVILVDGEGRPRAVWRTTEVRTGPLDSVDEAFAWDEGEGERTRADWLRMHRAFFARQAAVEGFAMRDGIETVFERFTIVWPTGVPDEVRSDPRTPRSP